MGIEQKLKEKGWELGECVHIETTNNNGTEVMKHEYQILNEDEEEIGRALFEQHNITFGLTIYTEIEIYNGETFEYERKEIYLRE